MAELTRIRLVLAVHDLAANRDFFMSKLGFHEFATGVPGWCFLERDGCRIQLGQCPEALLASQLGDHSYIAYIDVIGVDALHAVFAAKGVEVIKPLTDEHWGAREFGVRTPEGHRFMFSERVSD